MKKQLLVLSAFVFLLGGCESQSGTSTSKPAKITLTETEVKDMGNNSNAGAQLLVRKAVLKEMSQVKYTEDEKKELEEIKKNVEIEFFLNKKAMETTKVDDMEVLQVYQNNMDKLKEADIVQVLPQLKDQMLLQRREEEKVKYMNSLVEKYDLNAELKKHFPEIEKQAEAQKEVKPAVENKKSDDKVKAQPEKQVEKKADKKTK